MCVLVQHCNVSRSGPPKNRCCGDALDSYASRPLVRLGNIAVGCFSPKRLPLRATIWVSSSP